MSLDGRYPILGNDILDAPGWKTSFIVWANVGS
jgi:hypothetical protein